MQALLMIAAAAGLLPGMADGPSGGVKDGAKMFSASAVAEAEQTIAAIHRVTGWQTVVETVDSLGKKTVEEYAHDKVADVHGLYIVISKNPPKFYAYPSSRARHTFTKKGIDSVLAPLKKDLGAHEFDRALKDALEEVRGLGVRSRSTDERVGVRDTAKMFSESAIADADEIFLSLHRDTNWQIVVETVESLNGETAKDRVLSEIAKANTRGAFVLIAKKDRKVAIQQSKSAELSLPKAKLDEVVSGLNADFKAAQYDKGLVNAANQFRKILLPNGLQVRMTPLVPVDVPGSPATPPKASTAAKTSGSASANPGQEKANSTAGGPLEAGKVPSSPDVAEPAQKADEDNGSQSKMVLYVAIGIGAVAVLFLLGRVLGRSNAVANQAPYASTPPSSPQPQYVPPAANPQPGGYNAPPQRPMPPGYGTQPGYGQAPGYAPPSPGYGPGGYGPPPPAPTGGGGFMSGMLGGLGGAIAGNILYDKFGRPHPEGHFDPNVHGQAMPPGGSVPPAQHQYPNDANQPQERFDPSAGAGGSWGTNAQPPAPAEEWTGSDAATGDWSSPSEQPATDQGSWGEPSDSAGAGGSWDETAQDQGATAEWSDAPDAGGDGGGDWRGGDGGAGDGGGGDWGGDAPSADADQGAGGGW